MNISPGDVRRGNAVEPRALVGYLRANQWQRLHEHKRRDLPVALVMGREEAEVKVPLLADARDYAWLVAQLINALSQIEERPAHHILSDLRQFRTDIVRLRRLGREDAMLPLADGAELFSVAYNLLAAASLAASNEPRPSYGGRRPTAVVDFLREALLGQTEPGSFVVRVLVPLPPPIIGTQTSLKFPNLPPPPAPFNRRVTQTLQEALSHTYRAVVNSTINDTLEPFENAISHGVSAELCKALAPVEHSQTDGGIEISVSWGLSAPLPRMVPVVFQRDDLSILRQAAEYLAETQTQEDFELEGYITKLARAEGAIEGDITVAANVDTQVRKVLVRLPLDQYQVAANAHNADQKVRIRGNLDKEGRQYRLSNPRPLTVIDHDQEA